MNNEVIAFLERCLEFLIDLEAQLPTRRYFNKLLEDHHILILCKFAPIMKRDSAKLVNLNFNINFILDILFTFRILFNFFFFLIVVNFLSSF